MENSDCYSLRDTDKFIHDLSPNRLRLPYFPVEFDLARISSFTVKFFRLLCEDFIPLNQRHTQITCRVGPWTRETWACDFCFANKSSKWDHKISSCGVQSAECSSLKWSMVCKFGGTKEIVYINEAFKSHRIFFRTPTWRRTTRFQYTINFKQRYICGYLWEPGEVYF